MSETVFERDRRIRNAKLTMPQTFYLTTLNQFIGHNPNAWPSQNTIAAAMNSTKRAVQKWQAELAAKGILEIESGKGCRVSNQYRLNLDRLTPKAGLNDEPCSPLFKPNSEPRSFRIANDVRLNSEPRAHQRTMKDHLKEQGALIPKNLDSGPFRDAWREWLAYRRQRKQSLTPATIGKQLKKLAAWGPVVAVQSIEQSIEHGWQGLFEPKGGGNSTTGNAESETAWQTVLESIQRHSRFKPEAIMADAGERAWQAVRSIGLKRIDEAN